jgi:phasin
MDTNTKTTSTKSTSAPQAFQEMADKGTAQAKENFEKMSAAGTEAVEVIKTSYSVALKGVHEYNTKLIDFAKANADTAFEFFNKLSRVKSPSEFVELSTEHSRKQFETLNEQIKQLVSIAQKATLAGAEPLKTGITKAFNKAA